jgi:CHAT domain-containing protein
LPLHACWWNDDGNRRYLLDEFVVSYAPSLSVFKRCLEREHAGRKKHSVLAIANPVPPGNLTFSELECAEIERLLGNDRCLILSREQATKDAVMHYAGQRHWLHFSCHGRYQLDAPFESSLLLANKESLSVAEILERLDLRHTWLTVLSACETGLVDFREISDEHYGLPIGFLFAGTPTVWGTLWTVNDLTTALLMVKAYDELINAGNTKAKAIREAQLWLRDMAAADFEALVQERQAESSRDAVGSVGSIRLNHRLDNVTDPAERPFAHPYYWAAMQSVGA